mmetsp:Transcript_5549/g.9289  ORF Transcript_5549/g.9289 Transcript_5549/m.9289 type:complete len:422 (-) Transcript_5549:862-2127(-)
MAVPYGASITLWSPFRVLLLRTFTYPSSRDTTVSSARFLPSSTLLVAASDKAVHLWDVVAGHVLRTYRVGVASLAVHPTAPLFAVVTRLSSYTDDTTTSKSANNSMDEDDDHNNDKKNKSKSSSSAHPLAVQHTLLFAPTSDRMPRCVRRTVVGFSKRQQTRADVHPPTELLSEVAFADGDGANVSSEALFGLSRAGVLSCIQPAVPRTTHGAEESDASETNNDDVRAVDEPQSTVDYSVAYDKTIVKPKFINQLSSLKPIHQTIHSIFDGPSHVAPPLAALTDAFLNQLLINDVATYSDDDDDDDNNENDNADDFEQQQKFEKQTKQNHKSLADVLNSQQFNSNNNNNNNNNDFVTQMSEDQPSINTELIFDEFKTFFSNDNTFKTDSTTKKQPKTPSNKKKTTTTPARRRSTRKSPSKH